MGERAKLGEFLKEVINWRWDEFIEAEKDHSYTSYEAVVFSLVRACSKGKLPAIRTAIDRVDGKLVTPVKLEYPKFIAIYPYAKSVAPPPPGMELELASGEVNETTEIVDIPNIEVNDEENTVVTFTLRQTLEKMADQPRKLVYAILGRKEQVEDGKIGDTSTIPLVKSVIAANLLNLAGTSNLEAITEVFDQIDGKLVETLKLLGEDVFLTSYLEVAPYGAVKNKDGVYQLEAKQSTDSWREKLNKNS